MGRQPAPVRIVVGTIRNDADPWTDDDARSCDNHWGHGAWHRTADRLFGNNYRWSVLGAGRAQMQVAAMAASMGGNVRVGLEDSLWIGAGRLAQTNAEQVTQVRKIIEGLGLEIASPDEAREILQLKGGDKVAF